MFAWYAERMGVPVLVVVLGVAVRALAYGHFGWSCLSPVELSVAALTVCVVMCATTAVRASALRGADVGTSIAVLYVPLLVFAFVAFAMGVLSEATLLSRVEPGLGRSPARELLTEEGIAILSQTARWIALGNFAVAAAVTAVVQMRLRLVS